MCIISNIYNIYDDILCRFIRLPLTKEYRKCPKNQKSDIDGIMDYLSEANHDILVGFSEENRRKVEVIQNDLLPLRKILAFLSRRV